MQGHSHIASVLVRILIQEKDVGYTDSVVIGGLDQFLTSNSDVLSAIENFQMVSYSRITLAERETWSTRTVSLLEPSARKTGRVSGNRTRNTSHVITLPLDSNVKDLKLYNRGKM